MATGAAKPEKKTKKGGLAETTRFLLLFFLFAILLRTFVAPFVIPSGSMLPRMMIGDYLFVAKWPYGYSRYSIPFGMASFDGRIWAGEPKRGDVVVFRYPGEDEDYVKRLIGLPGDSVQMRGGQLILNGKPVPKVRIADWLMPVTPNSPCRYAGRIRPPAVEAGKSVCRYPRYRETLPGGRSYEVLDQIDGGVRVVVLGADETVTITGWSESAPSRADGDVVHDAASGVWTTAVDVPARGWTTVELTTGEYGAGPYALGG